MCLAEKLRPTHINDIIGQSHILNPGMVLHNIILNCETPSMVFYGPPGVGKTTIANIIVNNSSLKTYKLNGTLTSTSEIKEILDKQFLLNRGSVILFIDEVQYLSKKQQQILLEHVENGAIKLIASTTENPQFFLYNSLLSRVFVFEFKPLNRDDINKSIERTIKYLIETESMEIEIEIDAKEYLSDICFGDIRKVINIIDLCCASLKCKKDKKIISLNLIKEIIPQKINNYNFSKDDYYDLLSALQKSIRGSDPDAAVHYLAKLLEITDIETISRRLLVIASEDVGLGYPQAISIVKDCVDSALIVGLPEARIILSQAVILIAISPKSNSAYLAIEKAMNDINLGRGIGIPSYLKNNNFKFINLDEQDKFIEYKYPHNYKNNYVDQIYLPDDLVGTKYYKNCQNKYEVSAKNYLDNLKNKNN